MGKSRKYTALFKAYLESQLEYRANSALWALIEMLSLASVIILWLAVYRSRESVGNYSLQQIIAYYALIPLISSLTYVHVSSILPKQIKDGHISLQLLKPYSVATAQLVGSISLQITKQLSKLPVFLICVGGVFKSIQVTLNLGDIALALLICLGSFGLHFLIDICISYSAFWLDDVWALSHLKMLVLMVFGGMSFPLDLAPQKLQPIFNFLPFRFVYAFPIAAAQGRLSPDQLLTGAAQIILWSLFFWQLSRILWRRGLRRYEAYGN